jgi:hypothetical protein
VRTAFSAPIIQPQTRWFTGFPEKIPAISIRNLVYHDKKEEFSDNISQLSGSEQSQGDQHKSQRNSIKTVKIKLAIIKF